MGSLTTQPPPAGKAPGPWPALRIAADRASNGRLFSDLVAFVGSDDLPTCDLCGAMAPPGYPDNWYTPWPVVSRIEDPGGRLARDRRDNFNVCWSCVRELILNAPLSPRARSLAVRSSNRWERSQRLLGQAEDAFRGRVA